MSHLPDLLAEFRQPARLVTCESTGNWGASLRQLGSFPLFESRSADDCIAVLRQSPYSLVLVELSERMVEACLRVLASLDRAFPAARAVVLADRKWQHCEWHMRALGAVHFETSPRRLADVARIATRHLARAPAAGDFDLMHPPFAEPSVPRQLRRARNGIASTQRAKHD